MDAEKISRVWLATPQTGKLDQETKNVITAFQMRYRPTLFDGNIDAETAAMLEVLTRKTPAGPAANNTNTGTKQ